MKKVLMYTSFLLLGSAFMLAQDTGGDKLVGGREKPKVAKPDASTTGTQVSEPPDPALKNQPPGSRRPLASTKSHKGGKKGSKNVRPDLGDGSVRAASGKNSLNPQPLPPGLHAPDAQTQGGSRAKTRKTGGKKGGKVSTDVSTSGTQMKPGGPGVPPPTRPTDPK